MDLEAGNTREGTAGRRAPTRARQRLTLYGAGAGAGTGTGSGFHYLSPIPWQLYPELKGFLTDNRFPPGSLHLKKVRWSDRGFFDLFASTKKSKRKVLEPLLDALPRQRFVLVGDSSEKAPGIYPRIAERPPERIAVILIRDISGATTTNTAKRHSASYPMSASLGRQLN